MLTCSASLTLAVAAIAAYDIASHKRSMLGELSAQAEIIGSNSVAAITFGDVDAAEEILSSLKARKNITRAYLFDGLGEVFARVARDDTAGEPAPPPLPEGEGYPVSGRLALYKDIFLDGDKIGSVYVESDMEQLYSRLKLDMAVVGAVIIASMLAAFLMSLMLQTFISHPLRKLADTAKTVSKEKNYSVRAEKSTGDELGVLIDSFNEMLGQIQERDSKLAGHAEHLEEQVTLRTEELSAANERLAEELAERKKIEEERKRQSEFLSNLLESLSYPFYVVDMKDYTVRMANSSASFGELGEGESCFYLAYGFSSPCNQNGLDCPMEKVREFGKSVIVEQVIKNQDGSLRYVEAHGHPVFDENGDITQMIEYCLDVTERKQVEENLRAAKEQAEEATKLKDKYVSLVSHDLRSPFSSMLGLLKMIKGDKKRPMAKEHVETLSRVIKSGENMVNLIDRLLNISRLKTGRITPNMGFVDARQATLAAIEPLRHMAERKGVELVDEVPSGARLYADVDLMSVVIQNLVSNAIKFTRKGGRVTIFIPNGHKTTIAVSDTGQGVDERIADAIFEHDKPTSLRGTEGELGTGLGLPLSRDIIEAHGGSLTMKSVKGEGSVFYAEFPSVKPVIMLLNGDKAEELPQVIEVLGDLDVDVVKAANCEEAAASAERTGGMPHLIIVFIEDTSEGSMEPLSRLKRESMTRSIPVIVMVAAPEEEGVCEHALRMGAEDCVTKPVLQKDFVSRVRKFIV